MALRRGIALIDWIVPAAALALMPKCPMCVVVYVAVATGFMGGVGISFTTAAYLRYALIGLCIAALTYLAWRKGRAVVAFARRS